MYWLIRLLETGTVVVRLSDNVVAVLRHRKGCIWGSGSLYYFEFQPQRPREQRTSLQIAQVSTYDLLVFLFSIGKGEGQVEIKQ